MNDFSTHSRAFREGEEQVRIHVWVFKRDLEAIQNRWGTTLGQSKAIRTIIRRFLNQIDDAVQQKSSLPELHD